MTLKRMADECAWIRKVSAIFASGRLERFTLYVVDMSEITRSMKLVLQSLPWKDLDNLEQVRKIPQLSSYPLDEFVSQ